MEVRLDVGPDDLGGASIAARHVVDERLADPFVRPEKHHVHAHAVSVPRELVCDTMRRRLSVTASCTGRARASLEPTLESLTCTLVHEDARPRRKLEPELLDGLLRDPNRGRSHARQKDTPAPLPRRSGGRTARGDEVGGHAIGSFRIDLWDAIEPVKKARKRLTIMSIYAAST